MKIRIYVRVETFEILMAKKNERMDWLASQMSLSTWHAREVAKGRAPATPEVRKKLLETFRGMSTHRGPATWDDLFEIRGIGTEA